MRFDLVQEYGEMLEELPVKHSCRRTLITLHETLRNHAQFIDDHPTTLFQCLWNDCFWNDPSGFTAPDAADPRPKRQSCSPDLSTLLKRWRDEKTAAIPGFLWLRSLYPSARRRNRSLKTILTGHTNSVASVAWSPDGRLVASASWDGTVRIWNPHTGAEQLCFERVIAQSLSVSWSPNGRWIAVSGVDNRVHVFEAQSGAERLVIPDAIGGRGVAWSPDGKSLAAVSWDKSVKIWHADTGDLTLTIPTQRREMHAVAWSADGCSIAFCSKEPNVRIADAKTGKELAGLAGHQSEVMAVAWSPDGRSLASGSKDGTARIWDVQRGVSTAVLNGKCGMVCSVSWSPDGRFLACGCADHSIQVWDVATRMHFRLFHEHHRAVLSVAWSADGRLIASGSEDSTVGIWDVRTGSEYFALQAHDDAATGVCWSPDDLRIATCGCDRAIVVRDVATTDVLNVMNGHSDRVLAVSWSTDGKWIASASADKTVRVWDASTGIARLTLEHHAEVVCVSWSPDCRALATCSLNGELDLWNVDTGARRPLRAASSKWGPSVVWSPDGRFVACCTGDRTISIFDLQGGRTRTITLRRHCDTFSLAWSPDGKTLVTGGVDGMIRFCDPIRLVETHAFRAHEDVISALAWSRDGRRLASASFDRNVRVWEPSRRLRKKMLMFRLMEWLFTGIAQNKPQQPQAILLGHEDSVRDIGWSHNGRWLASVSEDKTLRVWEIAAENGGVRKFKLAPDGEHVACETTGSALDVRTTNTGAVRAVIRDHSEGIDVFQWSPDSSLIASGSFDLLLVSDARTGDERGARTELSYLDQRLAWTADSKYVARSGLKITILEVTTNRITSIRGSDASDAHSRTVDQLCWSPDGVSIAALQNDDTVRIWTIRNRRGRRLTCCGIARISWSEDSRSLLTVCDDDCIRIWNVRTGHQTHLLELEHGYRDIETIERNQERVTAKYYDGRVLAWTLSPGDDSTAVPQQKDGRAHSNVGDGAPVRLVHQNAETIAEYGDSGTALAWYPLPLSEITPLPSGARWIGQWQLILQLIQLEGDIPARRTAEQPSREAELPSSESTWNSSAVDLQALWQQSLDFSKKGDHWRTQRKWDAAADEYRRCAGLRRRLTALEPSNLIWHKALYPSYLTLGDAYLPIDPESALAAYHDSLRVIDQLEAQEPANAVRLWDRAVNLTKIGNARLAQGDATAATAAYEDALSVTARGRLLDASSYNWDQFDTTMLKFRIAAWQSWGIVTSVSFLVLILLCGLALFLGSRSAWSWVIMGPAVLVALIGTIRRARSFVQRRISLYHHRKWHQWEQSP